MLIGKLNDIKIHQVFEILVATVLACHWLFQKIDCLQSTFPYLEAGESQRNPQL